LGKKKVDEDFIINQSIILFRQQTYINTSVQDIANACGILKGSLYHYFKSKDELMKRVIERIHDYFKQEVFIYAYQYDLPVLERLSKLCLASEKVFYNSETKKLYGNIGVESAMTLPDFNPLLQHFFNDYFMAFKEIYKDKFPEKVAEELAERTVAEIEGSVMISRIYRDISYLKNTFERIKDRMD
jgi:TetR/AcrR family transcriptional repressor of nem operon